MRGLAAAAVILAVSPSVWAVEPGRVYFYAQRGGTVRSWLRVSSGGALVAELKSGKFFAVDLPPGRYAFSAGDGVPAFIETQPGKELFVRLDWHYETGRAPIPSLRAVDPDRARKEMLYLSYIEPRRAHAASVPKTDPSEPAELRLKKR